MMVQEEILQSISDHAHEVLFDTEQQLMEECTTQAFEPQGLFFS